MASRQARIQNFSRVSQGLSKHPEWGSLIQLIQELEDEAKDNIITSPSFDEFNVRKGRALGIEKVKTTLLQISPTRGQENDTSEPRPKSESGPESSSSDGSEPKPITASSAIEYAERGI